MNTATTYTTLFLDRDGVINRHRPDDYVKTTGEFEFLPRTLEALRLLAGAFPRIFIVTNQRGVGKGLMTQQELDDIHAHMLREITRAGGRIDHIYICTDVDKDSPRRKPHPGMAFEAQRDFPEVDLRRSLLAGDSLSDLLFARNAGMDAVFIDTKVEKVEINPSLYMHRFPDLYTFAENYIKELQA